MNYERYALPVAALLSGMLIGYTVGRRRKILGVQEETGTFVYAFPLDIQEDFEEIEGASSSPDDMPELLDEEMFPGYSEP